MDQSIRMIQCRGVVVEEFRSHRTHSTYKQLQLSHFYQAAAPHSGPIALLFRIHDPEVIKPQSQHLAKSIVLLDCKGEMLRWVPFDLRQRVIIFQFTIDEHLLIVYATGSYFLLDTATGTFHQGHLMGEEENKGIRCVGAHFHPASESIVVLREKTIGICQGSKSKWKPLMAVKIHSSFPIFEVVQTADGLGILYLNQKSQIELFNPRKVKKEVLFSHPSLKSIARFLLKLTLKDNKLMLLFTQFAILIDITRQDKKNEGNSIQMSEDLLPDTVVKKLKEAFDNKIAFFQYKIERVDPFCKTKSLHSYRNFYKSGWLGDLCYFWDRTKLLAINWDTSQVLKLVNSNESLCLAEGEDILRVIDSQVRVFRVMKDPIYIALTGHFQLSLRIAKYQKENQHFEDFLQLLAFYESANEKKPNQLQKLRGLRERAEKVTDSLFNAARQALDAGIQLKVLKMMQWTQTLFGVIRENKELMSKLRVVNGLKYQNLSRWLTLSQFQSLRNDKFLTMLLRSNMHYVADLIFDDSQSKKKIFMHWAKCKIEKETTSSSVQQIQLKYTAMRRDLHNKFVFTELALFALRRPTPLLELALKLAENESHPARKCMVFLLAFKSKRDLDLVDKLLDFAQQSFCAGAVCRTLDTLAGLSDVPAPLWMELLPKRTILEAFYLQMVRRSSNEGNQLQKYFQTTKKYSQLAYLTLSRQTQKESLSSTCDIILKDYSKILPGLATQIAKCTSKHNIKRLRNLKVRKEPITELDAEGITLDGQLQFLGELAYEKDSNWSVALKIWNKMKSDKIYDVLKAKGRLRDAIEVAHERKNVIKLQELLEYVPEEETEVLETGRQYLNQMANLR